MSSSRSGGGKGSSSRYPPSASANHNYHHHHPNNSNSNTQQSSHRRPSSSQTSSTSTSTAGRKLTATEELLYTTLYFQAQDAASPTPVLGDPYAAQFVNKIVADFTPAVFSTEPRTVATLVSRTKLHDVWLQRFLDRHASEGTPVTVLNLGCALDSRNLRVSRGAGVRWVDVDGPDAMRIRRDMMAPPPGDYHMITADVAGRDPGAGMPMQGGGETQTMPGATRGGGGGGERGEGGQRGKGAADGKTAAAAAQDSWLELVPNDRPTYVVAEELLMWLKPADGKRLVQRVIDRFCVRGGQFATDVVGSVIKELSWMMPLMRGAKARFHWAVNDGRELESLHAGLRLRTTVKWYELLGASSMKDEDATPFFGRWTSLATHIPGFKNCAQVVLFDFGLMQQMPPPSRRTTDSAMTNATGLTGSSEWTGSSAGGISSEGSQWSEGSYTGVSHKGSMNALGNPNPGGAAGPSGHHQHNHNGPPGWI